MTFVTVTSTRINYHSGMTTANENDLGLAWGDYEPATFDENGEPVDLFTHTSEGSAMRKANDLFSDEVLANRLERLCDRLGDFCADDLRLRWDVVEHDGYTHGELRLAFDMVANPDDWKGPVDSVVAPQFVELVSSAVAFYTATVPTTRRLSPREALARRSPVENPVRVTSPGYRNGPAGG